MLTITPITLSANVRRNEYKQNKYKEENADRQSFKLLNFAYPKNYYVGNIRFGANINDNERHLLTEEEIEKYKKEFGYKEIFPFQVEAMKHIDNGKSVVVCAPTGAGKTCIAEHAVHRALENGEKIFYTTPLKALSNQKYRDFCDRYGKENVGLLTGDTSKNSNAPITVMTTEVFRNMLYKNFDAKFKNLDNLKYVILDEVHYMNDAQRGTVWEESVIHCPKKAQIIALSATVANSRQLKDWMNNVHNDTELVYTNDRPVPLKFFYYKPETMSLISMFKNKEDRKSEDKKTKSEKNQSHGNAQFDFIYTLKKNDMLPAIYFTFSREMCEDYRRACARFNLLNRKEKAEAEKIIEEYLEENPYLDDDKHAEYIDSLMNGYASHHAGLLPGWKVLVEKLFQKKLIKVVFATETLAAGINMPAQTTVISKLEKPTEDGSTRKLLPNEFLQMSGRAGRKGLYDVGNVVVIEQTNPEFDFDYIKKLAKASAQPLESRFTPSYSMVASLLEVFDIKQAEDTIRKSFGYVSPDSRQEELLQERQRLMEKMDKLPPFNCYSGADDNVYREYIDKYKQHEEAKESFKEVKGTKKSKRDENYLQMFQDAKRKRDSLSNELTMYPCDSCGRAVAHSKALVDKDSIRSQLWEKEQEIANRKDIYWKNFMHHVDLMTERGYLKDNVTTGKGRLVASLHSGNELYLAEIIQKGILDKLSPVELASVICAITTDKVRSTVYPNREVQGNSLAALEQVRRLREELDEVQKKHKINCEMPVNPDYSPLLEDWMENADWVGLMDQIQKDEGDVIRSFRKTVDILRQIAQSKSVNKDLRRTAKEAANLIMQYPVQEA